MIRAVFKEWGGVGWALTSTSALLTWSAQLWWPFWIAAVLAGGFTAFMFFCCVMNVRDERTRLLPSSPPDPIAEMVATKRRFRADEVQRWNAEFNALLPSKPKANPKFTEIPNYPYFVELPAEVTKPDEIPEWEAALDQRAMFQPTCTSLAPTNPPSPRIMVVGPNPGAGTVINIFPPDPVNPRIDAVYETWRGIQVVTGIPAAAPKAPRAKPDADAKFLGSVVVRPYTTSITAADIHR